MICLNGTTQASGRRRCAAFLQTNFVKITMLQKSVQKLGGGLAQNWATCALICQSVHHNVESSLHP